MGLRQPRRSLGTETQHDPDGKEPGKILGLVGSNTVKTKARRTTNPALTDSIDVPLGGPISPCPARARVLPEAVRKQTSPASTYQDSGPGWLCGPLLSPGAAIFCSTRSRYCGAGDTGIGLISVTRVPSGDDPPLGLKLKSHTRPSVSATKPVALVAASAAAFDENVSMRHTSGSDGSCETSLSASVEVCPRAEPTARRTRHRQHRFEFSHELPPDGSKRRILLTQRSWSDHGENRCR